MEEQLASKAILMRTTETKLKQRLEPLSDLGGRTDYERDYTAILYSHAFRRLRHKTQVFHFPVNDHICTRLDHSLYVASTSSIICRNLNEKGISCDPILARAIGLGHDLGHTPFGHAGEKVLNSLAKQIGGFKHEKHGLRIVDKIEKPRTVKPIIGLNLTLAVRDGIANHNGESKNNSITISEIPQFSEVGKSESTPCTIEGCVVRLVDKVSYLGRDIEDAIVTEYIQENNLPARIRTQIGAKDGEIVDYFVRDIIQNSTDENICLSEEASSIMKEMIAFNYKYIYKTERITNYTQRLSSMLEILFGQLLQYVNDYQDNITMYNNDGLFTLVTLGDFINNRRVLYFDEEKLTDAGQCHERIVIDFISTLTDRYVFDAFSELFLPRPF